MAHKKGGGSSRNGRDSNAQRLGVKRFGGQHVIPGHIIIRQRGTRLRSGPGTYLSKDHSIHAKIEGFVDFEQAPGFKNRKRVVVRPLMHTTEKQETHTKAHPESLKIYAHSPETAETQNIYLTIEKYHIGTEAQQMEYYSCFWSSDVTLRQAIDSFTGELGYYPDYFKGVSASQFEAGRDLSAELEHGIVLAAEKTDYRKRLTTKIQIGEWERTIGANDDTLFSARFNTPLGDFLFHIVGKRNALRCKEIGVISHLDLTELITNLARATRKKAFKFTDNQWIDSLSLSLESFKKPEMLIQHRF